MISQLQRKTAGWLPIAAFTVATLLPVAAGATVVPKLEFGQLLEGSALVFRGTVMSVNPNDYDSSNEIERTSVVFRILDIFDGDYRENTIEFHITGGYMPDGRTGEVVGSPPFETGGTYVVFIRDGAWHYTPVTNWMHSSFREKTIRGRTVLVSADGRGVISVDRSGFHLGPKVATSTAWGEIYGDYAIGASASSAGEDENVGPGLVTRCRESSLLLRDIQLLIDQHNLLIAASGAATTTKQIHTIPIPQQTADAEAPQ